MEPQCSHTGWLTAAAATRKQHLNADVLHLHPHQSEVSHYEITRPQTAIVLGRNFKNIAFILRKTVMKLQLLTAERN